eukprot:1157670-Pelagomonas_calceolata.AAC.2
MEIDTPAPQIANSLFNYTVTALKPGGVVTSLVGNFVDSNTLNLIVGKSTHIELHNSTENGLEVGIWLLSDAACCEKFSETTNS